MRLCTKNTKDTTDTVTSRTYWLLCRDHLQEPFQQLAATSGDHRNFLVFIKYPDLIAVDF